MMIPSEEETIMQSKNTKGLRFEDDHVDDS
jgi:hypothetical protein